MGILNKFSNRKFKGQNRRNIGSILLILSVFSGFLGNWARAESVKLQFSIANVLTKSITLDELKAKLKVHKITLADPQYSKVKRYSAFQMHDILHLAYGEEWKKDSYTDVTFTALDGYKAVGRISQLKAQGGYIAFSDLDVESWELISRKQVVPGPFYLVWTGVQQTIANGFPWPWQLTTINLVSFEEQYPAVYPQGEI